MKLLLIFLGITFSQATLAYDSGLLSVGDDHTCAIDTEGLKCWGKKSLIQENIPSLKNPKSVSVAVDHACAIDDEGVKCWGHEYFGQTKVPTLRQPKQVTVGDNHTCAIDADGVKCWGWDSNGLIKVPHWISNPKQISAGLNHTCVVYNKEVKCWGFNTHDKSKVPPLKNPRQVAAGREHSCALDDEGVKCWGSNGLGQIDIPPLENPKQVSAGALHTCALDDVGVKCWGSVEYTAVPPLDFGLNSRAPKFLLKDVSNFLKVVALGSSPAKLKILNDLALYTDQALVEEKFSSFFKKPELAAARYTLVALIGPVIRSSDSGYYLEKVIPAYEESIEKIHSELGIRGLDDLYDMRTIREVALKVMQVSLSVGSEFLTISERKELQDSVRLLGAALAQVENRESVLKAIEGLEKQRNLLAKLEKSAKTAFLYQTIYSASEFLTSVMR